MGDWDVEACGGTHLSNTSEAGLIKIVGTERVQDGVERIVFSVGPYALEEVQRREAILAETAELLGAPLEKVRESVARNIETIKGLRHQLESLETAMSRQKAEALLAEAEDLDGVKLVVYSDGVNADFLIEVGNAMEELDQSVVAVMLSETQLRSVIKAGKEATSRGIHAGKLASDLAEVIGGGGGGAPYFAQGGGGDPEKFRNSADAIREAVRAQLA